MFGTYFGATYFGESYFGAGVVIVAPEFTASHFHVLNLDTVNTLEIFTNHAFDIDTDHSLEGAQ